MNIALLSPRVLGAALKAENLSTISTAGSKTIGCQICNSLEGASTVVNHSQNWNSSEKKCVVCGNNCGKPTLLDLFSGAGGASRGYQLAGFCVLGIDNRPQPHYAGCRFHLGDALEYCARHGREFDAIHASPPCQKFSTMTRGRWKDREHPDLIGATRELLIASGKTYVIENVEGARAKLLSPIMLCGSMFGLQTRTGSQLRRHRYFECPSICVITPPCNHRRDASVIGVYGDGQHPYRRRTPATIGVSVHAGGSSKRDYLDFSCFTTDDRRDAMGIDWMTGNELSQAIPPAYTLFIGAQLMQVVRPDAPDHGTIVSDPALV